MLDYTLGCNNWGICFVATKELPYTIQHPFSQVYVLQSDLFPIGAISEGPGEKRDWEKNKNIFAYDPEAQPTQKFNTEKGVFYDHNKDYMCMETTINGVADGIFMLALASRLYIDQKRFFSGEEKLFPQPELLQGSQAFPFLKQYLFTESAKQTTAFCKDLQS